MTSEGDGGVDRGWTRRRVLKAAGALAVLLPAARAGAAPTTVWGATMGTTYRVRIVRVPQGLHLPRLKRSIEGVLARTEALMSVYRPDSELSRFNASTGTSWYRASEDTTRVVAAASRVRAESGGAFNPAAAPITEYWGFGPGSGLARVLRPADPPDDVMCAAGARIDAAAGAIRKDRPAAALDLNGIAKGDALDRVCGVLEAAGVTDYLVEIGGEIRVAGGGPAGNGWRIGIDNPAGMVCVVELEGGAIATSGDYVDYYMRNGRRYCHIMDPRTGRPVEHGLSLVSVVADNAMTADAWATALLVMGPEAGHAYAADMGMAVLFMVRTREGFDAFTTPAFERLVLAAR